MKKNNYDFKSVIWPSFTDFMLINFSIFLILFIIVAGAYSQIKTPQKTLIQEKNNLEKMLSDYQKDKNNLNNELSNYKKLDTANIDFLKKLSLISNGLVDDKGHINIADNILFDSGSDFIKPDGKKQLELLLPKIKESWNDTNIPNGYKAFIRISGHTDDDAINTFKFPNNWYLSSSRALKVLELFVKMDFPRKNLMAVGFGEFQPLPNNTNKSLNRRIEIDLVIEKE